MNHTPTTTIISCIRHAQTTYGAEQRYAGTQDAPLSALGIADCAQAAQHLRDETFDVCITSPQRRALHTAVLVTPAGVPIEQDPGIVERSYGILEGRTFDELHAIQPPVLTVEVYGDTHSINPLGGEPFEEVFWRAREFAKRIFSEHAGERVLVVGHGIFLQMFFGVLTGKSCIESLGIHPANLELATFVFTDGELVEQTKRKLIEVEEKDF